MIIISRYNHITMGLLGYGGPMTVRWGEQMEKKTEELSIPPNKEKHAKLQNKPKSGDQPWDFGLPHSL